MVLSHNLLPQTQFAELLESAFVFEHVGTGLSLHRLAASLQYLPVFKVHGFLPQMQESIFEIVPILLEQSDAVKEQTQVRDGLHIPCELSPVYTLTSG